MSAHSDISGAPRQPDLAHLARAQLAPRARLRDNFHVRRLTLLTAALALCCAHRPSGPGGPAWNELSSQHFTVASDLSVGRAMSIVVELERARLALQQVSWHAKVMGTGRMRVVVFRDEVESDDLLGAARAGLFYRDLFGAPAIALHGEDEGGEKVAIQHELAHRQLAEFLHRSPRWLSEGLACYLETLRFNERAGLVIAGEPSRDRLRALHGVSDWTVILRTGEEALGMDEDSYARFQAQSWLLVHFLLDERRAAFTRFLHELAAGQDPEMAWRQSFPELDEEQLSRAIQTYFSAGRLGLVRAPAVAWSGEVYIRPLSPAEVHGLRAMVMVFGAAAAGSQSAALESDAEASAALREDPGNPDAAAVRLFWKFGGRAPAAEAEAVARQAVRAHPADWRSWSMLASALQGPARAAERRMARAKAAELAPDDAAVLNALAWEDVVAGRPQDALPVAERALQLQPADANIVDTYAAALAGIGECSAALRWQLRAVDLVTEGTGATRLATYQKRLRQYEAGCPPSSGGPTAATVR